MIVKNNALQIYHYLLRDDGIFPNSVLPVLIYQHAFNGPSAKDPAEIEKVFESNDMTKGWDGTYKGSSLNSGVFVYYVSATMINNKEIKLKGDITLIR